LFQRFVEEKNRKKLSFRRKYFKTLKDHPEEPLTKKELVMAVQLGQMAMVMVGGRCLQWLLRCLQSGMR
jgi:hypothetical protein